MGALTLRDATPADMTFIRDGVDRFRLDDEKLSHEQFVVAELDGRVVGFGRIKPYGKFFELGCLGVIEEARHRGVADAIVKELIRRFPDEDVWVTTDIPAYCVRFGFEPTEDAPEELKAKIRNLCHQKRRTGALIMRLRRSRVCAWLRDAGG